MKNKENIKIYVFLREKQVFYLENQKIKHFCINAQLHILKLLFKWCNRQKIKLILTFKFMLLCNVL